MVKSCIKNLCESFKREINVKFVTCYKTTKMLFFTNTKDKTPCLSQSSVVYKFTCPGCSYPNKKSNEESAIYEHLAICPHYSHIVDLFIVNNHDVNCNKFDINQLKSNTIVLDKADNWNELLFKEPLHWLKTLERVAIVLI